MKAIFSWLGIEKADGEVYLKLLELWAQSISVLAKNCNTPRSSMYVILERLKQSWIIEEFQRYSRKYVRAINPEEIENILLKKKLEIDHSVEILHKNMKSLQDLQSEYSFRPIVHFFEGEDEVRALYTKVLSYKEFQAVVNPWPLTDIFSDITQAIKTNKIHVSEFITKWKKSDEYNRLYSSDFHKIKSLPESYIFSSDTIITHDSVFMISYDGTQVSGFQIQSRSLVETQKILFDSLWNSIS